MNPLRRALRPGSRRILATRAPVLAASPATGVQARRWQHSHGGPIDPVADHEMAVGELEGAEFKIEPLRRTGEDTATTRARLTCKDIFAPLLPDAHLSPPPSFL